MDSLEVLFVKFQKGDMFLLKFILNDWSVKESFKRVKKLELSNNSVRIIKALGKDGSETALKFLDSVAEFVEVIIKLTLFNVHDVVVDLHELFDGFVKLIEDLKN